MSKKPSFWDGFKEGYDEQDRSIAKDKEKRSDTERMTEGAASGTVEGVANPVRWIGSLFD